ncbi:hypothetical protein [Bradyrhizobium sp. S3.12.5]|uniref:hypothetical protein n=1 Tax=Bradyrhizobium sp. S3.12.5 TaxID=3156386 RepID=UPI0033928B94
MASFDLQMLNGPPENVVAPGAKFGPMGLEGAVKLAFGKDLAAIEDVVLRKARFDQMVEKSYQDNKALSSTMLLEVDYVIDPMRDAALDHSWAEIHSAMIRPRALTSDEHGPGGGPGDGVESEIILGDVCGARPSGAHHPQHGGNSAIATRLYPPPNQALHRGRLDE